VNKFTFISSFVPDQMDGANTTSKITHEFEADTLDDILLQFTQFLRGAGFYFEGDVEIVDNTLPLTDGQTDNIPVPANFSVKDLEVKGKFYEEKESYPTGPANPTIYNMVDPPTGWRYGFPMRYESDKDGNLEDFLIKNGYPAEDAKFASENSRFWYESDNKEKV
jgi:hypothetical protein